MALFCRFSFRRKKIGLCHYANDVRFDFRDRNVFTYQLLSNNGLDPRDQFLYANSSIQKREVEYYSGLYLLNKNPELKDVRIHIMIHYLMDLVL